MFKLITTIVFVIVYFLLIFEAIDNVDEVNVKMRMLTYSGIMLGTYAFRIIYLCGENDES